MRGIKSVISPKESTSSLSSYSKKRKDPGFEEAGKIYGEMVQELHIRRESPQELWEIGRYVTTAGQDLLTALIQGNVNGPGAQEKRLEDVVSADGNARRHARWRSRKVMTPAGRIQVDRLGCSGHDTSGQLPMDVQLNLPAVSYRALCWNMLQHKWCPTPTTPPWLRATDTPEGIRKHQAGNTASDLAEKFGALHPRRLGISPVLQRKEEILMISFDCEGEDIDACRDFSIIARDVCGLVERRWRQDKEARR